ncbi:DNA polymerase III subunit delta' [Salinibius halmophilus]|uniref:DNA polymerase III subunit delta' n=1 Tax=Salinibius halmophilus TaxID=1853216 RepID=UPI000E66C44D|nr:DNA polymerase III subunit delta' [Salinibius halmophilus]
MRIEWASSLMLQLGQLWQNKQLAPSLLITGDMGIGVSETAHAIAELFRCRNQTNGKRCGQCHDCRLIDADTHPDFLLVAPDEGKKQIGVDKVRKANEFATTRPQVAACKVILIDQAERLNTASANAILKTLEEPASSVVFILATERPGQLLPTIRSRCQSYVVPMPTPEQALSYLDDIAQKQTLLDLARGRPVLAASLEDTMASREKLLALFAGLLDGKLNAVEAASGMAKLEVEHLMTWLQAWLVDLVKASLGQQQALQDPNGLVELIDQALPSDKLMKWVDQQISDISAMRRGASLNLQSWLESMLIDFMSLCWGER